MNKKKIIILSTFLITLHLNNSIQNQPNLAQRRNYSQLPNLAIPPQQTFDQHQNTLHIDTPHSKPTTCLTTLTKTFTTCLKLLEYPISCCLICMCQPTITCCSKACQDPEVD